MQLQPASMVDHEDFTEQTAFAESVIAKDSIPDSCMRSKRPKRYRHPSWSLIYFNDRGKPDRPIKSTPRFSGMALSVVEDSARQNLPALSTLVRQEYFDRQLDMVTRCKDHL